MRDVLFTEVTKEVHLIKDLILSEITCVNEESSEEALNFSKHLLTTKFWFVRISWINKKRYVMALLEDVRSVWTLSLLLKSMWNCRPKDAVLSASDSNGVWSSYDQVPMDHNRTAQPLSSLATIMKTDRTWFLGLDAESQALVICELLTISGGPIMWAVLTRAQRIFTKYNEKILRDLLECTDVNEQMGQPALDAKAQKNNFPPSKLDSRDKKQLLNKANDGAGDNDPEKQINKELEALLTSWNTMIKALRDSLKLEEFEMIHNDGTKRKVWKIDRPAQPEAVETVDFVQLLPATIGKMILSKVPTVQLTDCARVNKYWAYLVDELRADTIARQKLNADLEKLEEMVLRHDTSVDVLTQNINFKVPSVSRATSIAPSTRKPLPSVRASEKSAGGYSFRRFASEHLNKPEARKMNTPLRNLKELSERLDSRGAVDENLWVWCEKILRRNKIIKNKLKSDSEGVIALRNVHFQCPLMKRKVELPLTPPLYKDPAQSTLRKPKMEVSGLLVHSHKEQEVKKYNLWSSDFSSLFPVIKISSYLQSPDA